MGGKPYIELHIVMGLFFFSGFTFLLYPSSPKTRYVLAALVSGKCFGLRIWDLVPAFHALKLVKFNKIFLAFCELFLDLLFMIMIHVLLRKIYSILFFSVFGAGLPAVVWHEKAWV